MEWLSTEEIHEANKNWSSELQFVRDELSFLKNLITSFTSQLSNPKVFADSKKVINQLQKIERKVNSLCKQVQAHENQLTIMMDDVDQLKMEKAYIETHRELLINIREYGADYRRVKEKLFNVVSTIMKKDKQQRLLN